MPDEMNSRKWLNGVVWISNRSRGSRMDKGTRLRWRHPTKRVAIFGVSCLRLRCSISKNGNLEHISFWSNLHRYYELLRTDTFTIDGKVSSTAARFSVVNDVQWSVSFSTPTSVILRSPFKLSILNVVYRGEIYLYELNDLFVTPSYCTDTPRIRHLSL